jgi:sugar lactone lactonase YvrE
MTGIITAVAGTATSGFSGDGSAATSADLAVPRGVAFDALGNLYIADSENFRIRRVDTTGIITTVAGTGTEGFSGDGGPATSAELGDPYAVAVDALGNLYIADPSNSRIRRVDAAGIITTVAGTETFGFSGDGSAATNAELDEPYGVAVDALGNFYIADSYNNYIRRVDASGIITTVAGSIDPEGMGPLAQADLADPRALAVVSGANLAFVAGGSTGTVQAIESTPSWLGVVAGRYRQASATGNLARFQDGAFGTVTGVAYDAGAGVVYLTESTANVIHAVTIVDPTNADTWTIAPLANTAGTAGFQDGAAATAMFRDPTGLTLDTTAHVLYVADTGNHVLRAIDLTTATVSTIAGTPATLGFAGDGGAATSALLYQPSAVTQCGSDLFIADTGNDRVRRVASDGTISTVLGVGVAASSGEGEPASTFPVNAPLGLACDSAGNLYVTSTTTVRMVLAFPTGVVDGAGRVQTIYGLDPGTDFPQSATRCLTGLVVTGPTTVQVVDSCTGLLVQIDRVQTKGQP